MVKGLLKYKDMISLWKYHAASDVAGILKKQSDRMADMLDKLEDTLVKLDFTGSNPGLARGYEKQDLKTEWQEWIKAYNDRVSAKVQRFFDTNRTAFRDAKRNMQARAQTAQGNEKIRYDEALKMLKECEAHEKKLKDWENPFKPETTTTAPAEQMAPTAPPAL